MSKRSFRRSLTRRKRCTINISRCIIYIINSVNRKNPSPCPCIIKKILSPHTPVPNFMCKEQLLKLFFIPTVYNVLYPCNFPK